MCCHSSGWITAIASQSSLDSEFGEATSADRALPLRLIRRGNIAGVARRLSKARHLAIAACGVPEQWCSLALRRPDGCGRSCAGDAPDGSGAPHRNVRREMHEITTTMEINAPPRSVWKVLVDFPAHPQWNPFVRTIEGSPREGENVEGIHSTGRR